LHCGQVGQFPSLGFFLEDALCDLGLPERFFFDCQVGLHPLWGWLHLAINFDVLYPLYLAAFGFRVLGVRYYHAGITQFARFKACIAVSFIVTTN
jgi:hypothetical protein